MDNAFPAPAPIASAPKLLVAGVGNIFLGDDGFGVAVAAALATRSLPAGVTVRDFGIRGFDLAYTLLDPWDTVILVDAVPRVEQPGTLFTIAPDLDSIAAQASQGASIDPHGMDPVRVIALASSIGTITARILIVGCQPQDFGDELEGRMGLSLPVQNAVEEAANMVMELVADIHADKTLCTV